MKNNRNEFKRIFDDFLEICNRENIWYAVDGTTLLGTIRHGGFIPWDEKIQVMMTEESYQKLRIVAKTKVYDSSDDKQVKKLSGFFVDDIYSNEEVQPFIEIRQMIPTTLNNIKKYRSFKHVFINFFKNRKLNTKTSINDLKASRFEGFILLENRKQNLKKAWIQSISFKTETKIFSGKEVQVPIEYKKILSYWYGKKYMTAIMPKKLDIYISPKNIIKEEV